MRNTKVDFQDLGLIDYKKAWEFQEEIFQKTLEIKTRKLKDDLNNETTENHFFFCEHPHVYTLGKSGSESNLLVNQIQLLAKGATFYKINRGGDITYHGPGQIVGYPILDLENFSLSVKSYVHSIEEVIIETLKDFNIESTRLPGATGVWLDVNKPTVRKICAIGVRCSRWVTMHGFALNVNTDLNYFNLINPCGFTDKSVTSIQVETGKTIEMDFVKNLIEKNFVKIFNAKLF
ncbi:MAG: lipoyl(octanoyl) transferase LipB [Bacteroidetes bacterium]|nr:lipoyl(octanoyl) transferase LipB [Bacteroidota bacterium]